MAKKTEKQGGGGKAPAKRAASANAAPKKAAEAPKAASAAPAQPTQAEAPAKKVETRKKGAPVREM